MKLSHRTPNFCTDKQMGVNLYCIYTRLTLYCRCSSITDSSGHVSLVYCVNEIAAAMYQLLYRELDRSPFSVDMVR